MLHLNTAEKSIPIKIIVVVMILMGTLAFNNDLFAIEHHHRELGIFSISSSFRLSTTTELVKRLATQKDYINREFIAIQEEAAQGGGVHLNALATLLKEADVESFNHWMQSHYQILFDDLDHPEDLLTRVKNYRSKQVL